MAVALNANPTHLFAQFTTRDLILYALGIGCCSETNKTSFDDFDEQSKYSELRYVYEHHPEFQPFPTFLLSLTFQSELVKHGESHANIPRYSAGIRPFPPESLGDGSGSGIIPRIFYKDPSCIDNVKDLPVLHVKQKFTLHNPLITPQTTMRGYVDSPVDVWVESRVLSIDPRSVGVFVTSETIFYQQNTKSKVRVATAEMTTLVLGLDSDLVLRFGPVARNSAEIQTMTNPIPADKATKIYNYQIPQNSALLYRLSGDYNPIHVKGNADLLNAIGASGKRPLLHGLCTLGYAVRAVMRYAEEEMLYAKPSVLSVECNFVKPVFVGDYLRIVLSNQSGAMLQIKKLSKLAFKLYRASSNQIGSNTDCNNFRKKYELAVDKGVVLLSSNDRPDMSKNALISRL